MSLRRSALEILACLAAGAIAGATLMITWHGLLHSVDLASELLRYIYVGGSW